MSVQFDDQGFAAAYENRIKAPSGGMAGWMVSHGFAKDESGANQALIVLSIICFALAAYFAFK